MPQKTQEIFYTQIHSHPDVFSIAVPFPNISTDDTNCYVIKSGDDVLIVDTGAPTDESRTYLLKALEQLEIDRSKASYFLTHFHLDHAGLVDQIVPPDASLYVSKIEFDRTRPEALRKNANSLCERMLHEGSSQDETDVYRAMQWKITRFVETSHNIIFIEENDTINVGNFEFEVIDTSGHTPGHLSLFNKESGLFFSGDHMLFAISPSIDYFFDGRDAYKTYLDNLKKLQMLPIKMLLHSHGKIRNDYDERIDWLIEHHEERLEGIVSIIVECPGMRGIEIIRKLKWNVPVATWDEIYPLQRAVIIVQSLAMLDHLERENTISLSVDSSGFRHYHRC